MRIFSARLLAQLCIYLLSSVVCITEGVSSRTTQNTSARTKFEDRNPHLDSSKGKCQFNLTNSSHSLEADSSTYQHRGFSQCEYIIQAPSSRFILLNFTDIRSQSDMIVESSLRREQNQKAEEETITSVTKPTLSKIPFRKSQSDEKNVNTTTLHSHKVGQLLSPLVGDRGGNFNISHHKGSYNISIYNTSVSDSDPHSNNHKRDPLKQNSLSEDSVYEDPIKETDKRNKTFLNKDSGSLPSTSKGSSLELSTSARSSDIDIQEEPTASSHNCSLKLIIEEVHGTSGSSPQVICWRKSWHQRIPLVFQYSVPIRITYVWDRSSQSGFSLDFSFLKPEEVDCLFRCNDHLCLPKNQLCDGYVDCPDHSDEHNSVCLLARQQEENGEPSFIKVIVIIISVIVVLAVVLALIYMISHSQCHDGAHRGGGSLLQPPHSQSSEVCQSPSGSMLESGQYEALLHQHPQRQTTAPVHTVTSSNCSEHQQLLQIHQPEVEQQHHQCHRHMNRNSCMNQHHYMSQEHQIRSLSSNVEGTMLPDLPRVSRPVQHTHQLQQKFIHQQHSEQHLQQQRQCKQVHRHVSPSELYPPNIPLSADGEEGYAMSQKALHSKQQLERNWQVENEVFRPPPNKTVYDRDSPPPPYSLNPPGTKSLDSLVPPVGGECVLRQTQRSLMHQGSPTGVPRSHSLSCHH